MPDQFATFIRKDLDKSGKIRTVKYQNQIITFFKKGLEACGLTEEQLSNHEFDIEMIEEGLETIDDTGLRKKAFVWLNYYFDHFPGVALSPQMKTQFKDLGNRISELATYGKGYSLFSFAQHEKSYVPLSKIQEVANNYLEEVLNTSSPPQTILRENDEFNNNVIFFIYALVAPIRNFELALVTVKGPRDGNSIEPGRLILNIQKNTGVRYPERIIPISDKLNDYIFKYLDAHPEYANKPLLQLPSGNPLDTDIIRDALVSKMEQFFPDKHIDPRTMRHIWASDYKDEPISKRQELAVRMGHSLRVATSNYVRYNNSWYEGEKQRRLSATTTTAPVEATPDTDEKESVVSVEEIDLQESEPEAPTASPAPVVLISDNILTINNLSVDGFYKLAVAFASKNYDVNVTMQDDIVTLKFNDKLVWNELAAIIMMCKEIN